jgi:hypothetical protein
MLRTWLPLAALAFLGACAHPWNTVNAPAGATRDQVIAQSGPPARVVDLPGGGQRLQYTLQPLGHYAFMVDLDPAGRVVRSRQVLTEAEFHRIEPDRWTRADVEREFGPPAMLEGVGSFRGTVMTYRWRDISNSNMFYHVYVDPQGVVRRAHPAIEHLNTPNDRE